MLNPSVARLYTNSKQMCVNLFQLLTPSLYWTLKQSRSHFVLQMLLAIQPQLHYLCWWCCSKLIFPTSCFTITFYDPLAHYRNWFCRSIKIPSLSVGPFFIVCDQYSTSDLEADPLICVNSGINQPLQTSRRKVIVVIDQLFDVEDFLITTLRSLEKRDLMSKIKLKTSGNIRELKRLQSFHYM